MHSIQVHYGHQSLYTTQESTNQPRLTTTWWPWDSELEKTLKIKIVMPAPRIHGGRGGGVGWVAQEVTAKWMLYRLDKQLNGEARYSGGFTELSNHRYIYNGQRTFNHNVASLLDYLICQCVGIHSWMLLNVVQWLKIYMDQLRHRTEMTLRSPMSAFPTSLRACRQFLLFSLYEIF